MGGGDRVGGGWLSGAVPRTVWSGLVSGVAAIAGDVPGLVGGCCGLFGRYLGPMLGRWRCTWTLRYPRRSYLASVVSRIIEQVTAKLDDLRRLRHLRSVAKRQGLVLIRFGPHTQRELHKQHGPIALVRVLDGELVKSRLTLCSAWEFLVTDMDDDEPNWTSSPQRRKG